MAMISEKKGVEAPVFEWLERLGWTLKTEEDMKEYNRPLSDAIIEQIFIERIAHINDTSTENAKKVYDILIQQFSNPDLIVANEEFLNLIKDGITTTIDNKEITFRLIDYKDIWNNSLIATTQYWVQNKKPDIALIINGIPLVCIEAKQRARRNTNWLEGVEQFKTYGQKAHKLYITNAFGVACNGKLSKYGTMGSSSVYFFEWKDTSIVTKHRNPLFSNYFVPIKEIDGIKHIDVSDIEEMKKSLVSQLQPERVIDLIQNFIVFERTPDSGIVKKIARYQQYRATNKIVERVSETDLKQGIIWHTQGSGKSLTMLYTALKLRNDERLNNPTVYLIVDRKDLRTQIGDTFEDCVFPNTSKPENIGQLKHKISSQPSEVIITNIQKFRELGKHKDERDNVIALIDEAHRTQYGDFQSELKTSLPNCKRFAFTGTPIPKTQREFSVNKENEREPYLDKYGIKEAISDKVTVPIRYTLGKQEWFLDKEKLKTGFDELTKELSDEQKRKVIQRVSPWKVFLKKEDRVKAISKDIAEDFKERLEPSGFKAQIVAVDKEACTLYYNELLNYFEPNEIAIVFSETSYEDDKRYEMFKDHYLTDGDLKKLLTKFRTKITEEQKRKGNNLKILIVCNMLLTGFDAPIEQTMYLDSPLRDHTLLQAIARTNRPYQDKETQVEKKFGRIVDYVGIFRDINSALNYDPKDIGEFPDVDSLAEKFPEVVSNALSFFNDIKLEDSYECSINIVRKLKEIDLTEFEKQFKEALQLYEAISPHTIIIENKESYQWLITIYDIYLSEYKRSDFNAEIYAKKTRNLIEQNSKLIKLHKHLPEISIDEKYLDNLSKTKLSPDDKAEKIIRDIETVIRKNELESPVYNDFAEKLKKIIAQKDKESKSIEEILNSLEELYSHVDDISSLPAREGFPDKGSFDIFFEIKTKINDIDLRLVKKFSIDFVEHYKQKIYPGWQEYEKEKQKLLTEIKLFLADENFDQLNLLDNSELIEKIGNRFVKNYSWN